MSAVLVNEAVVASLSWQELARLHADVSAADAALAAKRMRAFGLRRILYGSDLSAPGGSIRAGWEIFRSKVPLTPAEFQIIASNRTRFAR